MTDTPNGDAISIPDLEHGAFSAADILRSIEGSSEETNDDKPEAAATGQQAEEEEEHPEEPEAEPAATTSDGELLDEEEDDLPELDPLLTELVKGDPKAQAALKNAEKGLQKLKAQRNEVRDQLKTIGPQIDILKSYETAFADPQHAGSALRQIAEHVAKTHGKTIAELLGDSIKSPDADLLPAVDEYGNKREIWERHGYATKGEYETAQRLASLEATIQSLKGNTDAQLKQQQDAAKQAQLTKQMGELADRTVKKLEKTDGWKVSKIMVEKALTEFPQLRNDPVRAVKAAFPDDYAKHKAAVVQSSAKGRGPTTPSDARGRGNQMPDPSSVNAAAIYARIPK